MGRVPCCDKNGLKKGPWTPEEDHKLTNYIQTHGPGNWRNLPKNADLQRCGKSCRLRWTNYLRPDIKRGRFSFEEEEVIIQLHSVMGNKWSAIAARLPGRTDNEIKNYWNTRIRKRLLRMGIDPVTHAPRLDLIDVSSILRSLIGNPSLFNLQGLLGNTQVQPLMNPELLKLAAAASLLSIKNGPNTDLASQQNILQQILDGNSQVDQNQLITPKQELVGQFQAPATTQATNVEGLMGNIANLTSCSSSPQNSTLSHGENVNVLQQDQVGFLENQGLVQSLNNNANQNLGYDSVLSSPNQMNSSSTHVNSSTGEERDSYCSELFKFEIPESLDITDFL